MAGLIIGTIWRPRYVVEGNIGEYYRWDIDPVSAQAATARREESWMIVSFGMGLTICHFLIADVCIFRQRK